MQADSRGEGHLAVLNHGHALSSIMGAPVAINAPSCPEVLPTLGASCIKWACMNRWRMYEKGMGEQRMLALQIHKRIVSVKERNCGEKEGQRGRDREGVRGRQKDSVPMHHLFSYF